MSKLHHLAITTTDIGKSAPVYDAVLGILGYTRGCTSDELYAWVGPNPEILLYAVEGQDSSVHTHGRPGAHHFAFEVESHETVEAVHRAAVEGDWIVVHPPSKYDYSPGYFAVFVTDPASGVRWEVACV